MGYILSETVAKLWRNSYFCKLIEYSSPQITLFSYEEFDCAIGIGTHAQPDQLQFGWQRRTYAASYTQA